jgi:hypothetical protein
MLRWTRFRIDRRRQPAAAGMAACLLMAVAVRAASDEPIQVIAWPEVKPSTVSIADQLATPAVASPEFESLDLATLANFAQSAAEEIAGPPAEEAPRPLRRITEVTIDAEFPAGAIPGDPGTEPEGYIHSPRPKFDDARLWGGWGEVDFEWSATALCHRPLYFEQVNLERYGYTVGPYIQPVISGAHFFLTIPTLPYKLVAQPPRECVYTLGYYRAGSRVPRRWHHVNWDPTAATVQGIAVTGLVFLIP